MMENKKNIEVVVIFDNGTCRRVKITGLAIETVKFAAARMPYLFDGTGFNPLDADASSIVAVTRADHHILHGCERERHQAAFRLGQMDMQQSAVDMLTDMAISAQGTVGATLLDAASRIRAMPLCERVEGDADGDT